MSKRIFQSRMLPLVTAVFAIGMLSSAAWANCPISISESSGAYTIQVTSSPNAVKSFGFDVSFDPVKLTYRGYNKSSCLTSDFTMLVNEIEPGLVRVGSFHVVSIPAGASGCLVVLNFDVNVPGAPSICLQDLVTDMAGWCDPPVCSSTITTTTSTTSSTTSTTVPATTTTLLTTTTTVEPTTTTTTLPPTTTTTAPPTTTTLPTTTTITTPPTTATSVPATSSTTTTTAPNTCGNGTLDPGEQCDDSNLVDGDCCSSACEFEDGACDDGDACTTGDTCSGGSCVDGAPLDCDDGDICNGVETCNPSSGCQPGTPLDLAAVVGSLTDASQPPDACVSKKDRRRSRKVTKLLATAQKKLAKATQAAREKKRQKLMNNAARKVDKARKKANKLRAKLSAQCHAAVIGQVGVAESQVGCL